MRSMNKQPADNQINFHFDSLSKTVIPKNGNNFTTVPKINKVAAAYPE
jgi:hypothetical protein